MIDIEKAIKWFEHRKGKVSYSMQNRNGSSSYDCSSSVYYALRSAGAKSNGWTIDTKHEHYWLTENGFEKITDNIPWNAKRGDIFIWEKRKIIVQVMGILEFLLTKTELFIVIILQMEFLWIIMINFGFMQADLIILPID